MDVTWDNRRKFGPSRASPAKVACPDLPSAARVPEDLQDEEDDMTTDTEVTRVEGLSGDLLLSEVGRAVLKQRGGLQARPPGLKQLIKLAREWLKEEHERLQALVCGSDKVREVVQAEPNAKSKIVLVVVDTIAAAYVGFPCVTIAEILARDGIKDFCKVAWSSGI